MDQKRDETFRVIDRRLFTEQGELRPEALNERKETEPAPKLEKPATSAPKERAGAPAAPPPAERSLGFEMLVDLIARNAVAYMGGMADPRTGQPIVDLEGAREIIDMMDALHEKTRGNLTPEEEQTLLDVIGSLKMSYLEISKAAAAARTGARAEKSKK